MFYKVYNIDWDKEGEKVHLPSEVLIECDDGFDIEKNGKYELCFNKGYEVKNFSYKKL